MGKLSFSIALNLITDGFKKGANDVKSGFSAMQAKILTFSAAFGMVRQALADFSSQVLDIVRDTNRAATALKNVSGTTAEFADNQKFLIDLSKKYGANVNDLSTAYAKFTASAKLAGMPLSIQKSLFESVSRATAAFALSSEDTNSVFLALSQMMGKGKVQAQELRLQMGEKLPVALQAMAKAAGVSVGKLDDMMQKGELLSGKVLPNFGKALNELIPNVDTDHLETSVNRWQNAKTELLKSTPVSDAYKLFIDSMTEAVSGLTSALNSTGMQNFFAGFKSAVTNFVSFVKENGKSLVVDIVALFAGIKISGFVESFKTFWKASSDAMVTNATIAHSKVRMLESATARLKRQIATAEVEYDKLSDDERLASDVQLNAKRKQLANAELLLTKSKNAAKVADERAAAVQSGNLWEATWAKIKTGAASLATGLKAVWSTVGPMILITLVTELIGKFYEWRTRVEQIKNSYKDYRAEASKATHTQEITELEKLKQQYDSTKKNSKERFDLEKRIGDLTGQRVTGEQNINKVLSERIDLLRAAAQIQFYTNKTLELQDRQNDLKLKYGGSAPGTNKGLAAEITKMGKGGYADKFGAITYKNDIDEYAVNARKLADATKQLAAAEKIAARAPKETPWTPVDDTDPKKKKKKADPAQTALESAETGYAKSLMEISEKEKVGIIKATEANKARQDLIVSTLAEVATSKYSKVRNSKFAESLEKKYKQMEENKPLEDFQAFATDYYKKMDDLKKQAVVMTPDEYGKSVLDLIDNAKKTAATFPDMASKNVDYLNMMVDLITGMSSQSSSIKIGDPKKYQRDSTFDYKKDSTDILSEELDKAKEKLDDLKSGAYKDIGDLSTQIDQQLKKVTSFSDILRISQLKKDIKDLKKQLQSDVWNGIQDIADGSNRIVESWSRLGETLKSSDATGWEKIFAIWQAMADSVNSIGQIQEIIAQWTKDTKELTDAKTKEAAVTTAANATEQASTIQSATVSTATTAVITENNHQKVAGNIASTTSAATEGAAELPFPFNLVAIAGTIAAVMAIMSSLPTFAGGGVFTGGSSVGDLNLARVNSGEMLLNGTQQKTLFNIIDQGGVNNAKQSSLSLKFRGSDMYLILSNYLKKTGKKL